MKQFLAIALTMVLLLTGSVLQAQCNFQITSINENFNALGEGQRPACWIAHYPVLPGQNGNFVHDGEYWFIRNGPASPAQMFMVVLPYSTVKGPLNFDLRKYPNAGALTLEVGTVTNPNDPNTFTNFQSITHSYSSQQACTVDFTSYAGTNKYIALRGYFLIGQGFSIDNVTWTGPPTSIKPVKTVAP